MRKMGNFKGLPVFMVTDPFEWQNIKDNPSYEEKIYVYRANVYYKENLIAAISDNILIDFDEDLFNELRRKSWDDDRAQMLAHVTGSAETRPKEEEKSVSETVETAGGTSSVDIFMASWRDNIDNKIATMKKKTEEMGIKLSELD
jgi:hypothetical protein